MLTRAITKGYTLRNREVRLLRRITKDFVTIIPFVIILIIPLSPLGHVLVFSFIQRFFPDFFPSQFTESRQNIMSMYSSITDPRNAVEVAPMGGAVGVAVGAGGATAVAEASSSSGGGSGGGSGSGSAAAMAGSDVEGVEGSSSGDAGSGGEGSGGEGSDSAESKPN